MIRDTGCIIMHCKIRFSPLHNTAGSIFFQNSENNCLFLRLTFSPQSSGRIEMDVSLWDCEIVLEGIFQMSWINIHPHLANSHQVTASSGLCPQSRTSTELHHWLINGIIITTRILFLISKKCPPLHSSGDGTYFNQQMLNFFIIARVTGCPGTGLTHL